MRQRQFPVDPCAAFPLGAPFGQVRGSSTHNGLDIKCPSGTPLLCVANGIVVAAQRTDNGPSGLHVIVKGAGIFVDLAWSYSHMSRVDVAVGQELEAGAQVGLSGRTGSVSSTLPASFPDRGAHLHFVVMRRTVTGGLGGSIDPAPLLPR